MQREHLKWLYLSAVIVALDQLSKYLAVKKLVFAQAHAIFSWLNFTLVFNKGASFGFLNQQSGWQLWLFSLISVIVIIALFIFLLRCERGRCWQCMALALIIGGAVGNLIDRVRLGHVVDFVSFHVGSWYFAIFNVADAAISVGACVLVITILFTKHRASP